MFGSSLTERLPLRALGGTAHRVTATRAVRRTRWRHDAGMPDEIVVATSDDHYDALGQLVREYWAWLHARYADLPGFVDDVGGHQAIDAELAALRGRYGPPAGKALLAFRGDQVTGGVAYRDLGDGSCEMKRLFVPDRFQGAGTGRLLCEALIAAASADGYRVMRLDTGSQNTEAIQMYEGLGFRECPPYQQYPPNLLPHLRFMERALVGDPTT